LVGNQSDIYGIGYKPNFVGFKWLYPCLRRMRPVEPASSQQKVGGASLSGVSDESIGSYLFIVV
jgi:hypothetical protein